MKVILNKAVSNSTWKLSQYKRKQYFTLASLNKKGKLLMLAARLNAILMRLNEEFTLECTQLAIYSM
jgi:hypothetical protein